MSLKKVISVGLVLACALSLAACGSDKKSEKESGKKTLVMATNAEFPPYEYYEKDEIVGIDAEFAKAIAEKLGMELEISDMAFDSIYHTGRTERKGRYRSCRYDGG